MSHHHSGIDFDISEIYDKGLGPVIFIDYAREMARRVTATSPRRILETATGTGIVTRMLRDSLPASSTLVATDLSQRMLEVAKHKFSTSESIDILEADAQDLPFGDGSFDTMVCQFGVMFYPDRQKSYHEAFRVLAPGGRYFFSVWDDINLNGFARVTDTRVKLTFPDDPPRFYSIPFNCADIDTVKKDLTDAGFTGIEVAVLPIMKQVENLDLFALGLVFGVPLVEQIEARGSVSAEAVLAELKSDLKQEFGSDPMNIPLQALFYTAIRP
ncbi:class I SAM-dependent methyltransferase [Streptomyces sp. NPDC059629]|uniref:class I SAM-dependent methyltransferase n=1 Tax=Streptomyces sp. NPDC059629 TaxID=3346889 RepID=UPI0036CA14DD